MTKKSTKEKVQKKVNNKIISIKKKLNAQDNVDKKIRKQKRHIFLIIMLIILIAIFLIGLAFIIYIIVSAPDFNTEELYSQSSTTLLDKNGNVDVAKVKPITFDPFNNTYVVLGDIVGKAFCDGKEIK